MKVKVLKSFPFSLTGCLNPVRLKAGEIHDLPDSICAGLKAEKFVESAKESDKTDADKAVLKAESDAKQAIKDADQYEKDKAAKKAREENKKPSPDKNKEDKPDKKTK